MNNELDHIKQAAFESGFKKQAIISLADILQSEPLMSNPLAYTAAGAASGLVPGLGDEDEGLLDRLTSGALVGAGAGAGALGGRMLGGQLARAYARNIPWENTTPAAMKYVQPGTTLLMALLGGLLTKNVVDKKKSKKK